MVSCCLLFYQKKWWPKSSILTYCESTINRGVPIFVDFVVPWNHEINNPTRWVFFIAFLMGWKRDHDFGNPRDGENFQNHEGWCPRIKVLSQYRVRVLIFWNENIHVLVTSKKFDFYHSIGHSCNTILIRFAC